MNYQIIVAVITATTAIMVAVVSFFLNENAKRRAEWQQKKFGHYQELLLSISNLANNGRPKHKSDDSFWTASNTIALIASQEVITALMLFHDEINVSNRANFSPERHDKLLKDLILAIRKDVGLSRRDNPKTFLFHLIGNVQIAKVGAEIDPV